ncbi:unnamed protein product, partial [marine sediment metagenome]
MNSYTGVKQTGFYILLQVVTHLVRFFHTSILGHHQVEFNEALASCLTGAQLVKAYHLGIMF